MTATCIGCSCTDDHACPGGCAWLRVDYQEGLGVCSQCGEHEAAWDATHAAIPPASDEFPGVDIDAIHRKRGAAA